MRFSTALLVLCLSVTVGCSQHSISSPLPAVPQGGATSSLGPEPSFAREVGTAVSFKSLHSFAGYPDGAYGLAGLVALNGTLYGTTYEGGKSSYGTVYKVTTSGAEHVLHSFTDVAPDGAYPYARLVALNGTLYGTTYAGGKYGYGTVFKVTTSGAEHVLHSFTDVAPEGADPYAGLVAVNGTLYGTTIAGGKYGYGTVYKVSTSGAEHVLHSFAGADGAYPYAGLFALNGTLYGTTYEGGKYGYGTIYKVSTSGAEHGLHSFTGADGAYPYLASLVAMNGTLYGTTYEGGKYGYGTVFKVSTSGAEHVLHSFAAYPDGAYPLAGLAAMNGTLYGTTYGGGKSSYGTVFKVSTSGAEHVLHSFTDVAPDGAEPYGRLDALNGTLYGTTFYGGKSGYGIVFKLTP